MLNATQLRRIMPGLAEAGKAAPKPAASKKAFSPTAAKRG